MLTHRTLWCNISECIFHIKIPTNHPQNTCVRTQRCVQNNMLHEAGGQQCSHLVDRSLLPPATSLFHVSPSVMFMCVCSWRKDEFSQLLSLLAMPSSAPQGSHPPHINMGTGRQRSALCLLLHRSFSTAGQSQGTLKPEGNILEISLPSFAWPDQVWNTVN